jgi:hypothetical protein
MPDEEFLTVAEAAASIDFTIPRLRRLLARPDYARHCKTIDRQTRTGTRTAMMVPVSLLSQIANMSHAQTKQEQKQEREHIDPGLPAQELIAAYERIIAEKDARIKDLTDALEHERERSRRHADAYARAQALLSLTNPP